MAQDSDKPTALDKGKGKATENGKPEDVQKDKDGKPLANGKKEDDKDECMRPCPLFRRRESQKQTDTPRSQPPKNSARRTSNSRASLICLSRG